MLLNSPGFFEKCGPISAGYLFSKKGSIDESSASGVA